MDYLDLSREDSMFVITSGGDNALHYAIAAGVKRVSSASLLHYHQLMMN